MASRNGLITAILAAIAVCCSTWTPIDASRLTFQRQRHFSHERSLATLFELEPLRLSYHSGMMFTGSSIPVYLIWYGGFSASQRSTVADFFASFQSQEVQAPSVGSWWALTRGYLDASGAPVSSAVELRDERSDENYSMGRYLTEDHLEGMLMRFLADTNAPTERNAFYLVLTADDVYVEGFCTRRCGSHFTTASFNQTRKLPYAWVGNSASQCPGKCAWPFANGEFGYDTPPLASPSGDVGMEGMIINIAAMLAGTATNPFRDGYFQGDSTMPLEAATACAGVFAQGAYSGYPGELQTDGTCSFNAHGVNNRRFLLPALWNPATSSCSTPA